MTPEQMLMRDNIQRRLESDLLETLARRFVSRAVAHLFETLEFGTSGPHGARRFYAATPIRAGQPVRFAGGVVKGLPAVAGAIGEFSVSTRVAALHVQQLGRALRPRRPWWKRLFRRRPNPLTIDVQVFP